MFGIFKKQYDLIAPISGDVLDLSKSKDPVFAQRLAGDGVVIEPTSDIVVAPADGVLTLIFRTNHAFGMILENGVEILVHLGIDTVELNGEGFERIAEEGKVVKAGDPIIKINRQLIIEKGYSLSSPVLITNPEEVNNLNFNIDFAAEAGKDVIISYKK